MENFCQTVIYADSTGKQFKKQLAVAIWLENSHILALNEIPRLEQLKVLLTSKSNSVFQTIYAYCFILFLL